MIDKSGRKKNSGFTLVEFFLALSIFAVVGVAVAAALRAGVDAWRRAEETGRVTQEARRVLEDLALELRSALTLPGKAFEGGPDRLSFDAYLVGRKTPGIFRVSYGLDPKTGALTRARQGYGDDRSKDLPRALTSRRVRLSFAYPYRHPEQENATQWRRRWKSSTKLPRGVRVRLTLHDRSDRPHSFLKTLWVPVGAWP